ncbi:SsgA family sporulation/cell division regulator [Streptomyces venezuelae]|uniref:SsgA family sporulation/cell division regulator n=1 Tax=Streptomyces venezuelae TaxID=54571 RepID=A0A5P2CT97_STRVZ|nr:SsgA family sporulation/cell division regulator [Streptomyces venezuelae]QES45227.1 SsgA family sporulation/cell division regulator [Streptomyces venezuelae]
MTITQPLRMSLIFSDTEVPIPAVLIYHSRDPYAVLLDTNMGTESHAVWTFARDLLADGISAPGSVGDGDVRIMRHAYGAVFMSFTSPEGMALAEVDADDIDAFLTKSYATVPEGTEREHLGMDAELAHLLGEAA